RPSRLGEFLNVLHVIDADAHFRPPGQLPQAAHLDRSHHLVGDEDVHQPRVGEDLRLIELRAEEVLHSRGVQVAGQARTFERLEVNAHRHRPLAQPREQSPQVRIDYIQVYEQLRRIEGVQRLTNRRGQRG